jgi:DNA repair exonuclease SbcCD nuclease subunit
MCLDGIAGIRFVLQGRPIHTIAIVKSHISFYRNVKKIVAKRTASNHKQKFFQTKSIVWSHFVMNIRKWNKLV